MHMKNIGSLISPPRALLNYNVKMHVKSAPGYVKFRNIGNKIENIKFLGSYKKMATRVTSYIFAKKKDYTYLTDYLKSGSNSWIYNIDYVTHKFKLILKILVFSKN